MYATGDLWSSYHELETLTTLPEFVLLGLCQVCVAPKEICSLYLNEPVVAMCAHSYPFVVDGRAK